MKKLTLSALFLLFISAVSAQGFKLGLHATPGLSWVSPSDSKDWESDGLRPAFSYGLILDYNFTDNYAFSTGVSHLTVAGGKISTTGSNLATISLKSTLQYINLPLTLKLKTNEIGYMTYFGQFGITSGVNIKARGDIDSNTPFGSISLEDEDIMEDVQFLNLGLTLGAGLEYSLGGETALLANLGYNNGFTNVFTKEEKSGYPKSTLNMFYLRLGILF